MDKILNVWFSLSEKIRFLFVGGLNYIFACVLFVIISLIVGKEHYQLNLVLSWFLSSFFSYATQRFLVFQSNGNIIKEYSKCFVSWMLSYALNAILLEITVSLLHFNIFVAQFISAGFAAVLTYILFKFFAFKEVKD